MEHFTISQSPRVRCAELPTARPYHALRELLAQYYTNRTWSGAPTITRCDDTINNDWGTGGPFGTSPVDNFSVSWSGSQYFTKGINTVSCTSDDGMQVWVDGQLVINNNGIDPAAPAILATITCTSDGFHDVFVKYYEATGQAVAKLSITSAENALDISDQLMGLASQLTRS